MDSKKKRFSFSITKNRSGHSKRFRTDWLNKRNWRVFKKEQFVKCVYILDPRKNDTENECLGQRKKCLRINLKTHKNSQDICRSKAVIKFSHLINIKENYKDYL